MINIACRRDVPARDDHEWSEFDDVFGEIMIELFLRYRGQLHAATKKDTRNAEKTLIRRQLSPQLREFTGNHQTLKWAMERAVATSKPFGTHGFAVSEETKRNFGHAALEGWKFVPLVIRGRNWICELKIVFLRRNQPGEIYSGGDLDNRIKTLFDGLRMPHERGEVTGQPQSDEDNICYCLLEDDSLIAKMSIETGQLWGPLDPGVPETGADVDLSLYVTVRTHNQSIGFI